MTQSAVALKTITDNGHERRTDGVLRHLGSIVVGPSITVTPPPASLDVLGQGRITGIELPISNGTYYQGHLQLYNDAGTSPNSPISIGFHNAGRYGLALYSPANSAELRIRYSDGRDYPVAGAPSSVNQPICQYTSGNGSTYSTGVWTETSIQATGTTSGGLCRIDISVCFWNNTVGRASYIGFGVDGTTYLGLCQQTCPGVNYIQSYGGTVYHTPAAGVHRFAVMCGVDGGTMSFHGGMNQCLYVTEQRA